jgi:NAD+ diphosphatase
MDRFDLIRSESWYGLANRDKQSLNGKYTFSTWNCFLFNRGRTRTKQIVQRFAAWHDGDAASAVVAGARLSDADGQRKQAMRQAEQVTFGGASVNRLQALRGDPVALAEVRTRALVLPFWRGRPLVSGIGDETALVWLPSAHPLVSGGTEAILLGETEGIPRFAIDISASLTEDLLPQAGPFDAARQPHPGLPSDPAADQGFADLRSLMAALTPDQAELAVMAKGILEWHRTHGFCAACGAPSTMAQGGWQRICPACAAPHFPRTDPVVIVLVTLGNRVLLGRSPGWPDGMYSLLAGFVEPGETVEAACRREVAEETGVPLGAVSYLASQPWPFPASLMIGCRAEALDDKITLDPVELDDALWVSREDVALAMTGAHPRIKPSRRGSIAQFILNAWLADRLD